MASDLMLGLKGLTTKRLSNTTGAHLPERLETSGTGLDARANLYSIALKKHPPERRKSPRAAAQQSSPRSGPKAEALALYHSQLLGQACREKDVRSAFSRLELMMSRGLTPESTAYNEFVEFLARDRLEEAQDWLQRPNQSSLYPSLSGVHLNETSYNAILTGLGQRRDLPQAERYATEMQELGLPISVQSFTELALSCLAQNEVKRAHRWCCLQVESGPGKPNKEVIKEVVNGLADKGNVSSARYWLKYMEDHARPLDSSTYEKVQRHTPQEVPSRSLLAEGGYASGSIPPSRPPVPSALPPTEALPRLENGAGDVEQLMLESVKATPRSPRKGVPKILVASGGLAMKVMRAEASDWGKPKPAAPKNRGSIVAQQWAEEMATRNSVFF